MEKRAIYYSRLIGVLAIVVWLCMRVAPVDKLQYYVGERILAHFFLKACLLTLLLVFNYKILKYAAAWNVTLSLMIAALAYYVSFFIFGMGMGIAESLDNQKTPLGWQFKYLWAENLLFGFLIIVLTEAVYVLVKSGRLLKAE